jgi:hypothetical protein
VFRKRSFAKVFTKKDGYLLKKQYTLNLEVTDRYSKDKNYKQRTPNSLPSTSICWPLAGATDKKQRRYFQEIQKTQTLLNDRGGSGKTARLRGSRMRRNESKSDENTGDTDTIPNRGNRIHPTLSRNSSGKENSFLSPLEPTKLFHYC